MLHAAMNTLHAAMHTLHAAMHMQHIPMQIQHIPMQIQHSKAMQLQHIVEMHSIHSNRYPKISIDSRCFHLILVLYIC